MCRPAKIKGDVPSEERTPSPGGSISSDWSEDCIYHSGYASGSLDSWNIMELEPLQQHQHRYDKLFDQDPHLDKLEWYGVDEVACF